MPFIRPRARSLAARTGLLKELSQSKHFTLCQIGSAERSSGALGGVLSKIKNAAFVPFIVVERCVHGLFFFFFFFFFFFRFSATATLSEC